MVAAVIWNCYTAEVGGIIILPRTGFYISQFQSSLASLRRKKKSRRMCRLPLAHYTKQWNCLFLLCLLGFFTQSSPSHDAVLWFHFVGRLLSYPIPKKKQWKWRKWGWNDALQCQHWRWWRCCIRFSWTSWVFFPMDSDGGSEFAWGLQPWSGMGTIPGEAVWVFLSLLRFLTCKRKQVRKSTLTKIGSITSLMLNHSIDIAKPQLYKHVAPQRRSCLNQWEMMVCFEVLQHTTHRKIWLLASTSWCPPTSLMGASLSFIVFVDIAELLNQWHLYCHPKRAQYFDTLGGPCCVFRASPFGEARHTHTKMLMSCGNTLFQCLIFHCVEHLRKLMELGFPFHGNSFYLPHGGTNHCVEARPQSSRVKPWSEVLLTGILWLTPPKTRIVPWEMLVGCWNGSFWNGPLFRGLSLVSGSEQFSSRIFCAKLFDLHIFAKQPIPVGSREVERVVWSDQFMDLIFMDWSLTRYHRISMDGHFRCI